MNLKNEIQDDKKPYFFDKSLVETGKMFSTRKFNCFYLLSQNNIYLFYLSKDKSNEFMWVMIFGGLIKGLYDWIHEKKLNINKVEDFPELRDLPKKLKDKIPSFNRVIIISKNYVLIIKFHIGDLVVKLKNGKKFRIVLFPNNIKKVKRYLKSTNWI